MEDGRTVLRAAPADADILGHSPDTLMKTHAHAMPQKTAAVIKRIGERPT